MTADEIITTLCLGPFSYRKYLNCPNVSFGWGLMYEADLISVSKAGYAAEIEVKVTEADLLKDKLKSKFRYSNLQGLDKRIQRFYYAVPEELREVAEKSVDDRFGIIVVSPKNEYSHYACRVLRKPLSLGAEKITQEDRNILLHLVQCRYWSLRLGKTEVEYEGDPE